MADQLKEAGIGFKYEAVVFKYIRPSKYHKYTADFILPNGIVIETKGRFLTADRQKHKLLKEQHPHLDIRFVFSRATTRLSKTSKTTYSQWSEQNGFQWADKLVPVGWLTEPIDKTKLQAIKDASK